MAKFGGGGLNVPNGNYLFTVTGVGDAKPFVSKQTNEAGLYSQLGLSLEGDNQTTNFFTVIDDFQDCGGPGVIVGEGQMGSLIHAINPDIPIGTVLANFATDYYPAVMGRTVMGEVKADPEGKFVNVKHLMKADWQPLESDTYLLQLTRFTPPKAGRNKYYDPKEGGKEVVTQTVLTFRVVDGDSQFKGEEIIAYLNVGNFEEFGGNGRFTEKCRMYNLFNDMLDTMPEEISTFADAMAQLLGKYVSAVIENKDGRARIKTMARISSRERAALGLPKLVTPPSVPTSANRTPAIPVRATTPTPIRPGLGPIPNMAGRGAATTPAKLPLSPAPWAAKAANPAKELVGAGVGEEEIPL